MKNKHDYDTFEVQSSYDHDACVLNSQVITKVKTVSYYTFSLCRSKDIKETISWYIYDVLALLVENLVHPHRLLVERAPPRYTHYDADPLRWKIMLSDETNNKE